MTKQSIGFIGLGIMGSGMAANLAKEGYPLKVWNRTRSRAEQLAPHGVTIAVTPREAAEGSGVVFTMLSDPPAVEQVAFGPDGAIEGLREGAILIDCSTVDPATSKKLADAAASKGARFIDCPVGGSKVAAAQGELILMVGADNDLLEEVRPILDVVSRKIVHAGGQGMGTYLKLCFNLLVANITASLAESILMAAKAGLDPAVVLEAVASSVLANRMYEWKGNAMLNRDFSTNFSLKLMHKDLNLIMSAAGGLDIPLPVTASTKELYGIAENCCNPEEDFCSVIKGLETITGIENNG